MKKIVNALIITILIMSTLHRPAHGTPAQQGIFIASGVIIGSGALYVAGRGSSALLYALAKRRYEPEMDLVRRMAWKESVLEEELAPYIFDQHAKMNESFLYYPGIYKNYPLLKYKKDLDFYINYLWFLQLFRLGTTMRNEITIFLDKLQIIRRYIVTDYRFIKEQRQFDKR